MLPHEIENINVDRAESTLGSKSGPSELAQNVTLLSSISRRSSQTQTDVDSPNVRFPASGFDTHRFEHQGEIQQTPKGRFVDEETYMCCSFGSDGIVRVPRTPE